MKSYALRVLECPDKKMHEPRDGSVLAEWGVVGGAEGEVSDEADDSLHERPPE